MNRILSIHFSFSCFTLALAFSALASPDAPPWSVASFADEAGYQRRISGMIERIARQPFLERSMAVSRCPDTGLTVRTWALEGEAVISPYTGRTYRQGPTGYFGPKSRDAEGRIATFGGDPLKYALTPATAVMMLAPPDPLRRSSPAEWPDAAYTTSVEAYLSIPGNLRQQYHFAAVNWVRFLGLAGSRMSPDWHGRFQDAVAIYSENRRPSDGAIREYQPLPRTETLIGVEGELLGGGGTENHKTMWRSAGLLYAQLFPQGSRISDTPQDEAIRLTSGMLTDYVRQLLTLGNGEYDSSTYYPYSFRAFANLFDYSPDPATRAWSQAALDYYFATYGLKVFNGVHTGPQRRGWVDGHSLSDMDAHLHAWVPDTSVPVDYSRFITTLHQATSSYRPNRVISNLIAKRLPLPFEYQAAHPDYAMIRRNQHPSYGYVSSSYAMASVQIDKVNNSAQQTTWSLNVRGPRGSLVFGGGQPRWAHPEGHSPYDQWLQKRGALLFLSGNTVPKEGQPNPERYTPGRLEGPKGYSRQAAFSGPLDPATAPVGPLAPKELQTYFDRSRTTAATWLFLPKDPAAIVQPIDASDRIVIEAPDTWVIITPISASGGPFWVESAGGSEATAASRLLEHYRLLVMPGFPAGFAIEALERSQFAAVPPARAASLSLVGTTATYRSHAGDHLVLDYQPTELRPRGIINAEPVDWSTWADGGVYESPYLKIKDGRMWVSDGREAYTMEFTGALPVWQSAPPKR